MPTPAAAPCASTWADTSIPTSSATPRLFSAHDAADFLALLHATIASNAVPAPGSPLAQHLSAYPKARAFLDRPKPVPSSYGREVYYGLTAVLFINQAGRRRYGRYRFVPEEGPEFIADDAAQAQPSYFLFEELKARMGRGEPIRFRLVVQLAEAGDEVNDSTIQWPDDRPLLDVGRLEFTDLVPEPTSSHEQQHLIFDPVPRLDGIETTRCWNCVRRCTCSAAGGGQPLMPPRYRPPGSENQPPGNAYLWGEPDN